MMLARPIKGTLFFFCGKMGAGKSTHSLKIAQERRNAVLLSEDEWLSSLYPNQIKSVDDYIHFSRLVKAPMKQLVQSILITGTDVVMDFPANTLSQRQWFQGIVSDVSAPHELIHLDVPDEVCLERIAKRGRPTDTEQMFANVNKFFVPPTDHEAFCVTRIDVGGGVGGGLS